MGGNDDGGASGTTNCSPALNSSTSPQPPVDQRIFCIQFTVNLIRLRKILDSVLQTFGIPTAESEFSKGRKKS